VINRKPVTVPGEALVMSSSTCVLFTGAKVNVDG
jgi:hypothetical protein